MRGCCGCTKSPSKSQLSHLACVLVDLVSHCCGATDALLPDTQAVFMYSCMQKHMQMNLQMCSSETHTC